MHATFPDEHRLSADPTSVRAARRAVVEAVGDLLHPDELDEVLLATSEIVTNALEHGEPPLELRISTGDGRVRIEVRDRSPVTPRAPSDPGPSAVRGRGMVIVERCSDRWGVDPEPGGGKAVWFERRVGGDRGEQGTNGYRFPNDSTPR